MLSDEVRRSFFHELGHFVASSLNYQVFHSPKIREMVFEEVNPNKFIGHVKLISIPEVNLQNFGSIAANVVYGCFFEGISNWKYEKMCLDYYDCFSQYGHGKSDRNLLISLFIKNHLKLNLEEYTNIPEELKPVFDNQIIKMSNDPNLMLLFNLNISDYFSQFPVNMYNVNIEKLEKEIHPIIDAHKEDYINFVKNIKLALFN